PKIFNVRSDPFERGDQSIFYDKWMADRAFLLVPAQALAAKWLESFKEFPIRQKPASFKLDEVVESFMPPPASFGSSGSAGGGGPGGRRPGASATAGTPGGAPPTVGDGLQAVPKNRVIA